MNANILLMNELWQYHILPYLNLSELCLLKRVSKYFREQVRMFFSAMKVLDITGYKDILTEDGFGYVVIYLKNLSEVYLTSCWKCASVANLKILMNRCANLTVFVADHCGYIDDDVLEELGKRCKSLTYLDISYCFNVTDMGLCAITRNLSLLEVIHISSNYGITDASIESIVRNCTKLTSLDVAYCIMNGASLHKYTVKKTNLKEIRVTKCRNVPDQLIRDLVQNGIVVNSCF